jgi:hypothetical protein
MALPIADDLAAILNVDEFATAVTYRRKGAMGDSTINGIFDNETVPVETGGFVPVHEEQPRFTCRTSDVPNIVETDELVISGSVYTIRAWVHDGTGVTVLQLERK